MSWVDGPRWDRQRAQEIVSVLVATYQTSVQISALISSADIDPAVLEIDGSLGVRWLAMVRRIHELGRLPALLAAIVAEKPTLKKDVTRWSSEPKAVAGNPRDLFEVRLMGHGRRPLIGRRELRTNMREFLDDEVPVLIIRGNPRTGKSYSRDLLVHVLAEYPSVKLRDVDMSEAITGTSAVDLMAKLCLRLGIADVTDRDNHTTPERFAIDLVDALVGQFNAVDREGRTVIFIDGLNRTDLEPAVYVMIAQLATEVFNAQLQRTQVILTGFGGTLDRDLDADVSLEVAELPGERDLREFFTGLVLDTAPTEAQLDAAVRKAWRSRKDITKMGATVRESALAMLGAGGGR